MKEDRKTDGPSARLLTHLTWSFLWRAIGIASLVYFGVGLISVAAFYIAFVLCHAPRSIAEIIAAHSETGLWVLFAVGFLVSPVLAFRMLIGKQFGKHRLTLTKSADGISAPFENEGG